MLLFKCFICKKILEGCFTAKKTVLITGAAKGIGSAIAKCFLEDGYFVAINYFNSKKKAEELLKDLKKISDCCEIFYADVSKEEDVENMFFKIEQKVGFIDVLVNNAGVCQQKLFLDVGLKEWQHIFDVNVTGMFLCCKRVLPLMIKHKKGKIINISSIWGVVGSSCEVAYSASKAAVIGLTKALAKEVSLSGINVNCVAPGVIKTDMLNGLTEDEIKSLKEQICCQRLGLPKDVANAVLFLADEKSNYITGEVLNVGGGFCL